MSQMFSRIEPALQEFIERQRIFFTGSATADSRVNVSPKGSDSLRVIGPNVVAYLDQTGSGNEAAAHLRADGRLTIMFCAFEGPPMILRLYGRGRSLPEGSDEYERLLESAFGGEEPPGARQIVLLDVEAVQTSLRIFRAALQIPGRPPDPEELGLAQGQSRHQGILAGEECRQYRWPADRDA
jgi:hypothetical protein